MEKTIEQMQAETDALWEVYYEASKETSIKLARWTLANAELETAKLSARLKVTKEEVKQ